MPVISKITGAPFRLWCQKILPAVYDDSLSYYELLCKVVDYLNKVMEDDINVVNLVNELEQYMNSYFSNLDVQEEINNKLDAMAASGELGDILEATVQPYVTEIQNDMAELQNSVEEDMDNLSDSVDQRIETLTTNVNTTVSNFESTVTDELATQDASISVLESRMDTFSSLTEGSTTGDAELTDIRVPFVGVTYDTAGNAVRGQVKETYSVLGQCAANLISVTGNAIPINLLLGSVNTNTGAIMSSSDGTRLRSQFIPVMPSKTYTVTRTITSPSVYSTMFIVWYNKDFGFLSSSQGKSANPYTVDAPADARFFVLRIQGTDLAPEYVTISITTETTVLTTLESEIQSVSDALTSSTEHTDIALNAYTDAMYKTIHEIVPIELEVGSYNTNTGNKQDAPTPGTRLRTVGKLSVSPNNTYYAFLEDIDSTLTVLYYASDGTYISYEQSYPDSFLNLTVPANAKYCAVRINGTDLSVDEIKLRIFDWYYLIEKKFKVPFYEPGPFVNSYTINRDTGETGRVSRLYALMDNEPVPADTTVIKSSLGLDASSTFPVNIYKVKRGAENKPVVLLIGGMHGNELNSTILSYWIYHEILNGSLKESLDYVEYWCVPVMNPYGYEHNQRDNSNDVNLNRDFPANWTYQTSAHNATGLTSLSQVESQYIYNLIVQNQKRILFIIDKHDTGSIASKIEGNQPGKVGYIASILLNDIEVAKGIVNLQDMQTRETDPWVTDIDYNLKHVALFTARKQDAIPGGSLDEFTAAIGLHGYLLEVCGAAYYGSDDPQYYDAVHRSDLARIGLDFYVNTINGMLKENWNALENHGKTIPVTFRTRVFDEVEQTWVDKVLYWNGEELY